MLQTDFFTADNRHLFTFKSKFPHPRHRYVFAPSSDDALIDFTSFDHRLRFWFEITFQNKAGDGRLMSVWIPKNFHKRPKNIVDQHGSVLGRIQAKRYPDLWSKYDTDFTIHIAPQVDVAMVCICVLTLPPVSG